MSSDSQPSPKNDPHDSAGIREQLDITVDSLAGVSIAQSVEQTSRDLHPAFREFPWAEKLWNITQTSIQEDKHEENPASILQDHLRKVYKLREWRKSSRRLKVQDLSKQYASSSHSDPISYHRLSMPVRRSVGAQRGYFSSIQRPTQPYRQPFSQIETSSDFYGLPGSLQESTDISALVAEGSKPIVHIHHHYYHHVHHNQVDSSPKTESTSVQSYPDPPLKGREVEIELLNIDNSNNTTNISGPSNESKLGDKRELIYFRHQEWLNMHIVRLSDFKSYVSKLIKQDFHLDLEKCPHVKYYFKCHSNEFDNREGFVFTEIDEDNSQLPFCEDNTQNDDHRDSKKIVARIMYRLN